MDSDEEDEAPEGAGPPDQEPADMGDDGGEPEGEGMLLSMALHFSDLHPLDLPAE